MYPTIAVGPFSISVYTLVRMAALAIMIIAVLLRLRGRQWPITAADLFLRGVPLLTVGLVAGSIAENVLTHLATQATQGVPFPPGWWLESRWLGAFGGASLAGYLYCRQRGLPVGRTFDLFAVPLPLVAAVGRTACLLNGCCYGQETTAWPAIVLPDVYGVWASRYPTQPAGILANLLIFVVLLVFEQCTQRVKADGWPFYGFLYLSFAVLHLGQRFLIEFWRVDTPRLGTLTLQQFLCAAGIGLAGWLLVRGLSDKES
ncbi:MAG: prolipoprotein diacylglyceryl transferase [Anaerolineae bacterium]|nr:prolipoprotein diacylglyceryl transferase [Anaerolineae bacterium]